MANQTAALNARSFAAARAAERVELDDWSVGLPALFNSVALPNAPDGPAEFVVSTDKATRQIIDFFPWVVHAFPNP